MYQIRRLNSYMIDGYADHETHIINKSKMTFDITDEEFDFLSSLKTEYDYISIDGVLVIDRHPSMLKGHINEDFIKDYADNLNRKFYVLYEYKKV